MGEVTLERSVRRTLDELWEARDVMAALRDENLRLRGLLGMMAAEMEGRRITCPALDAYERWMLGDE